MKQQKYRHITSDLALLMVTSFLFTMTYEDSSPTEVSIAVFILLTLVLGATYVMGRSSAGKYP